VSKYRELRRHLEGQADPSLEMASWKATVLGAPGSRLPGAVAAFQTHGRMRGLAS
jgi:hypothetical protein